MTDQLDVKQQAKKSSSKSGLELVLFRNAFYRDQSRYASIALFILLIINALLFAGVIYKSMQPSPVEYFAITDDSHALSDPSVSDTYVLQWTADKVRKAFSDDFLHYRGQLQSVSDSFTSNGWNDFYNAMMQSNNLKTLVSKKMVSDVKITKAPVIEQSTVVSGHYAWKISMSIMVTYTNSSNDTINMPFDVSLIVIRESVENYPDRIAINNFLPTLVKTERAKLLGI